MTKHRTPLIDQIEDGPWPSFVSHIAGETGHQAMQGFFSLSYSSYAVLPRVLINQMPDEWQGKLADLLTEFEKEFPNQPGEYRVLLMEDGKLIKNPEWLLNYRYPNQKAIDENCRPSNYMNSSEKTYG